jgi:methylmalonyl-CoA carboxyltransferase large subunit
MALTSKSLLPLAIAGGGATGAVAAFFIARRELRKAQPAHSGAAAQPEPRAAGEPERPAAAAAEELSPETLAIISAAVSAFLGKTARVRGIRPARPAAASPWSQQGRVHIQGSHVLVRP